MNSEKLKSLESSVRIGGKGTARRKRKNVHRSSMSDDKKLQASLKKLNLNDITSVEEVHMVTEDGKILHFPNPKVQAAMSSNTFSITGKPIQKDTSAILKSTFPQSCTDEFLSKYKTKTEPQAKSQIKSNESNINSNASSSGEERKQQHICKIEAKTRPTNKKHENVKIASTDDLFMKRTKVAKGSSHMTNYGQSTNDIKISHLANDGVSNGHIGTCITTNTEMVLTNKKTIHIDLAVEPAQTTSTFDQNDTINSCSKTKNKYAQNLVKDDLQELSHETDLQDVKRNLTDQSQELEENKTYQNDKICKINNESKYANIMIGNHNLESCAENERNFPLTLKKVMRKIDYNSNKQNKTSHQRHEVEESKPSMENIKSSMKPSGSKEDLMNTENMSVLQRMSQRAAQADQMVALLQAQIAQLKSNAAANACRAEEEKLKVENDKLRLEVEKLKRSLTNVEVENGVKQVALPKLKQVSSTLTTSSAPPTVPQASPVSQEQKKPIEEKKNKKAEKKEKKGGDNKGKQQAAPELPVDISRLDMRVGLIRAAKKHPDADGLYVEEVDVGEETPRTIISGLVKFVPLEQMQNRLAIFLLNLKPAKMRGIMSQGMIMCGSSSEVVEIIVPPPGSEIGDRVVVEGYDGSPDALLNPKKKIWEQVQPDLRINNDGLACYKGVAWNVAGKGTCSVPTMRDKIIK